MTVCWRYPLELSNISLFHKESQKRLTRITKYWAPRKKLINSFIQGSRAYRERLTPNAKSMRIIKKACKIIKKNNLILPKPDPHHWSHITKAIRILLFLKKSQKRLKTITKYWAPWIKLIHKSRNERVRVTDHFEKHLRNLCASVCAFSVRDWRKNWRFASATRVNSLFDPHHCFTVRSPSWKYVPFYIVLWIPTYQKTGSVLDFF